jgi:molybdenum cofactor cytidylyltransferase
MIAGILLAAGAASRFGSDKLLYPLPDGTPMAVAATRNLKNAVDTVFAVVRPGNDALMALLRNEAVRLVIAEDAAEGMGRSLACGIAAAAEADGWLIALGDMPFISPRTMHEVVHLLENGALIAAPVFQGQRGHPVGFARALYAELVAQCGDEGARAILERHRHDVAFAHCEDAGILQDVDSAADLKTAAAGLTGRHHR